MNTKHSIYKDACQRHVYRMSNSRQTLALGKTPLAAVGVDPGAYHCVENLRRCSLHRRRRSATWRRARVPCLTGQTVRMHLEAGRSARAQGRWSLPAAPESRSREGPRRGGEILGFVLGREATLDTSNRRRAEQKRII
jgi:hypothetical protein